jgi:hypothetical protein
MSISGILVIAGMDENGGLGDDEEHVEVESEGENNEEGDGTGVASGKFIFVDSLY